MCGFAGIVDLRADAPPDAGERQRALVEAMCATLQHRGPDDRGVEASGRACLGSLRLKILDLSDAGHMPMRERAPGTSGDTSADARGALLVYNGEVYNFRELRAELEALGHAFRSQSDTEVVLHAWREWGPECVQRFVGMFAAAHWDPASETLSLVRDRFGIKPLVVVLHEGLLCFASEAKAFAPLGRRARLDERRWLEWSLYQNVDVLSPRTLVEGVETVLPGTRLVARAARGTLERVSWYDPPARVERARFERSAREGEAAAEARVEALLGEAVRARLVSDVPVGTLLSGGLDSSLITALAGRETRQLTGFHVSIEGHPEHDESVHARRVADSLGIELVTLPLTPALFRGALVRTIWACEQPLEHPNSVAYGLISEVARRHGVIVLLSGEGADELFGGYAWRYHRARRLVRLQRWLERVPRRLRRALELAGYASAGLPVTSHRIHELLPQAVGAIDRHAREAWRERCTAAYDFVADPAERAMLGLMLSDLEGFLTPLLRRLDRTSMAHSIECRVPFLDHRLVEEAIHQNVALRVGRRDRKRVLKRIARRHLPAGIVERRKVGFPLPLADYVAPLARPEPFESGVVRELFGLSQAGLRERIGAARANPLGFLNLLSWELWGRMVLGGEPVEGLEAELAALAEA